MQRKNAAWHDCMILQHRNLSTAEELPWVLKGIRVISNIQSLPFNPSHIKKVQWPTFAIPSYKM